MLVIIVIYDEFKFIFWYSEISAYYVYNLVYLCRSLLEQQIELVLSVLETIITIIILRSRYNKQPNAGITKTKLIQSPEWAWLGARKPRKIREAARSDVPPTTKYVRNVISQSENPRYEDCQSHATRRPQGTEP